MNNHAKFGEDSLMEGKLRDSVNMGAQDVQLEDKTLTVVFGPDLVNINYINFCCNNKDAIQLWKVELLKMAYNILALNACPTTFLEKAYTKILLSTDKDGKIPVKNIVRMFAQHKDERRKVEKALNATNLPSEKGDFIVSQTISFKDFMNLYRNLTDRKEVEKIFEQLCGNHKKKHMLVDQLVNFLKEEQTDPRLNEMLHPYPNAARAKEIIAKFEPNKDNVQKGHLSFDGFISYLMSDDNAIIPPRKLDLYADTNQPLNHYFINSSHNTYLTGHQLTGRSSIEMYRQSLLAGCRCIELDCWNGRTSDEEPIITHGYTVVSDINLKEVLEAIAESAFKTSPFPIILSFENHCSPRQQAKIATYCHKILGDLLLTEPISSCPVKPGQPLPPLNALMRKIIIKNKKHHHRAGQNNPPPTIPEGRKMSVLQRAGSDDSQGADSSKEGNVTQNTTEPPPAARPPPRPSSSSKIADEAQNGNFEESDTEMDSDDEEISDFSPEEETRKSDQGTAGKETEAGDEMSALVNYIQPVRFHSFEHADRRNRSYEISSFVETQATNLLKEHPIEFVNYNKRQLSRVYPRGTRVDSSNYMPQVFWNAGCQLVALNFQSLDLAMQLNFGIFEYNGRCGYLLRPDFMRRNDRKFDPFAESTVDGIIAGTVSIRVISGQFLSDRRLNVCVEVDMFGLPADTVRRKFRTKAIPNVINPVFDDEPFVFKKVVLPDLACIRIAAVEDNGKFIGHRVLPVGDLRPGYRHIPLKQETGQPLMLATLFVHIVAKDYVPDGLSELADALANPIEYQSKVEKHAQQLCALTDDYEDDKGEDPSVSPSLRKLPEVSVSQSSSPSKGKTVNSNKNDSMDSGGGGTAQDMNGSLQRSNTIGSDHSPGNKLVRQDTTPKKNTPSIKNTSDDGSFEKTPSLLETSSMAIIADPIAKIRENRLVYKVIHKMERELQNLRKKHEKAKEKERELQQIRIAKETQSLEKQKAQLIKTQSKMARKMSKTSGNADVSSFKRQSESDLEAITSDHNVKMQEIQKAHTNTMQTLFRNQCQVEQEIYQKFHTPLYAAMQKAMETCQLSQIRYLEELYKRDVSDLMGKLELQTKDQLKNLGKKHKDKNELARVKRELNQKHIGMAVTERQRFMDLYKNKEDELKKQHDEIKKELENDKEQALKKILEDYESKYLKMIKEFEEMKIQVGDGAQRENNKTGQDTADSTVL
ncbi:1-phosphatidylinositol 4,5-bisphosphate phosphodiesterase classes I and II [Nymphon striatum]|nr:1-phosphatidylinositol 4,5-bisphosphate phosphodiesterase classes I and II [Nymphon striatum]